MRVANFWQHTFLNSFSTDQADSAAILQPQFNEDFFYQSAVTGSFFPPLGPRLTLRKRIPGKLPTMDDSADDLDNLDDVIFLQDLYLFFFSTINSMYEIWF